MYYDLHRLGSSKQASLLQEAQQMTNEMHNKRSFMQQQDSQQDEQLGLVFKREKQRLDTLAGKRLQQARAELLKQAGAEIRSAVAELNQHPQAQEVRLANKPGEAPLQRQASPQIMQAAKGDSPETLPQKETTHE